MKRSQNGCVTTSRFVLVVVLALAISVLQSFIDCRAWAIPADSLPPPEDTIYEPTPFRPTVVRKTDARSTPAASPINTSPTWKPEVSLPPVTSVTKCMLQKKSATIAEVNYQHVVQINPRLSSIQSIMQGESEKAKREFDSRSSNLSEKQKQEYYEQLQKRLQLKNQELMVPLFNEVDNAIKRVADTWGIHLVVDAGAIICGTVDISSAVEELMLRGNLPRKPADLMPASSAAVGTVNYQLLVQQHTSLAAVERQMQAESEAAKRELDSKASGMSETAKKEYFNVLQERLKTKNQQLMVPIFNDVDRKIKIAADGLGLDAVVDAGAVIYGGVDITARAR